ncbi:hypothetical protein [uncultured Paenibacillus sp.]|uniref:hypothetical protein n=1 Tax=uncultured Paenibacillus sp. TaxID=227322 RepID=UPI0025F4F368|nr:hypothetical protein [uncultured Paenibacillus sp.]
MREKAEEARERGGSEKSGKGRGKGEEGEKRREKREEARERGGKREKRERAGERRRRQEKAEEARKARKGEEDEERWGNTVRKSGGGAIGGGDGTAKSCVNQAVGKPLFFVKGWRRSIFLIQTLALRAF